MANLMTASKQWSTRPADERFTSLETMLEHFGRQRAASRQLNVSSKSVRAIPTENSVDSGLQIMGWMQRKIGGTLLSRLLNMNDREFEAFAKAADAKPIGKLQPVA